MFKQNKYKRWSFVNIMVVTFFKIYYVEFNINDLSIYLFFDTCVSTLVSVHHSYFILKMWLTPS